MSDPAAAPSQAGMEAALEAFLKPWLNTRPEMLRMIHIPGRELARALHDLEGVHVSADVGRRIEDCEILEGEMFEECLADDVWISPQSGLEVPAGRVLFYADLEDACRKGLHGFAGRTSSPADPGS